MSIHTCKEPRLPIGMTLTPSIHDLEVTFTCFHLWLLCCCSSSSLIKDKSFLPVSPRTFKNARCNSFSLWFVLLGSDFFFSGSGFLFGDSDFFLKASWSSALAAEAVEEYGGISPDECVLLSFRWRMYDNWMQFGIIRCTCGLHNWKWHWICLYYITLKQKKSN